MGPDGAYSYAVDPTDDQFYEIAVRFGDDAPRQPPTPVPTAIPTPKPPLTDTYPTLQDALSLLGNTIEPGTPLSLTGSVIGIDPVGGGTRTDVQVASSDGSVLIVTVISPDDLVGVFPGSTITVYGVFTGVDCDDAGLCRPEIQLIQLG
jgi:hypothetical protein